MYWFPANVCREVVFSCVTKKLKKRYLSALLDFLSKLYASILFVQVFEEFVDFFFVCSNDCIVNLT